MEINRVPREQLFRIDRILIFPCLLNELVEVDHELLITLNCQLPHAHSLIEFFRANSLPYTFPILARNSIVGCGFNKADITLGICVIVFDDHCYVVEIRIADQI